MTTRQREPFPTCSACGRPMFWDMSGPGPDGYRCDCDDEPEDTVECPSCGYQTTVGGCDECGMEVGS